MSKFELTVPLIETMIVPVTVPKRRPADIVNGMAGIASIYTTENIESLKVQKGAKHKGFL